MAVAQSGLGFLRGIIVWHVDKTGGDPRVYQLYGDSSEFVILAKKQAFFEILVGYVLPKTPKLNTHARGISEDEFKRQWKHLGPQDARFQQDVDCVVALALGSGCIKK